jgi:hypothetical protein
MPAAKTPMQSPAAFPDESILNSFNLPDGVQPDQLAAKVITQHLGGYCRGKGGYCREKHALGR